MYNLVLIVSSSVAFRFPPGIASKTMRYRISSILGETIAVGAGPECVWSHDRRVASVFSWVAERFASAISWFLSDDQQAWLTTSDGAKTDRVVHPADYESRVEQSTAHFLGRVGAFVVQLDRGRREQWKTVDHADRECAAKRVPADPLLHFTTSPTQPPQVRPPTGQPLTVRQKIKNEVPTGPELFRNATNCPAEVFASNQVIYGVEVGGDQVDGHRQAQRPKVLLKQVYTSAATVALGDTQHCRRAIHSKNRHSPTAAQVACEQPRPAPDVRGG